MSVEKITLSSEVNGKWFITHDTEGSTEYLSFKTLQECIDYLTVINANRTVHADDDGEEEDLVQAIKEKTNLTMPFGKYKGLRLDDVPANYLLWLYDQEWCSNNPLITKYITQNLKALREEEMFDTQHKDERREYLKDF